jgi:hypothetical protein
MRRSADQASAAGPKSPLPLPATTSLSRARRGPPGEVAAVRQTCVLIAYVGEVEGLCCRTKAVLRHGGRAAYCFPCLATKLTVSPKEVLDAAQVLILHPEVRVYLGACHTCYRWERVIRALTPRTPGAPQPVA